MYVCFVRYHNSVLFENERGDEKRVLKAFQLLLRNRHLKMPKMTKNNMLL